MASGTAALVDGIRKGPLPLTHEQIVALSGEVYRRTARREAEHVGHALPHD